MRSSFLALAVLALPALALAQPPNKLGYQGRLLKADGSPEGGSIEFTIAVFDAASGGNKLWSEIQTLALSDGYYATQLGSVTAMPADLFASGPRFLSLTIGGTELSPRQEVTSVAWALYATNLSGGTVEASGISLSSGGSISVGGTTVVNGSGQVPTSALSGQIPFTSISGSASSSQLPPIDLAMLSGVTGSGKGFDADTVDGVHASGFIANGTSSQSASFNVSSNGTVGGNLTAGGNAAIGGSATVGSTLTVTNAATLNSTLSVTGAATVGGGLTLSGDLDARGLVPTGGGNLIPNPDLRNGERGWGTAWAYAGYAFSRTRVSDANAPVRSRFKEVFAVTSIAATGDATALRFSISSLKLGTDYHMSCYLKTSSSAIGTFIAERFDGAWTPASRSDVTIPLSYQANGNWQRVGGVFNTGAYPNAQIELRAFNSFGTWEITACQLTEGKQLNSFSVDLPDLPCPNDSVEKFGFCIFPISGYDKTYFQAAAACRDMGARLCTLAEVNAAWAAGAQWCSCGWVADKVTATTAKVVYPMQTYTGTGCCSNDVCGCGDQPISTSLQGANCCR